MSVPQGRRQIQPNREEAGSAGLSSPLGPFWDPYRELREVLRFGGIRCRRFLAFGR